MKFLETASPPAAYVDKPHTYFARWRTEAPLQYLENPGLWMATSYDRVSQLLRDKRLQITSGGTFSERSRQFRITVVRRLRAYFGAPDAPFIDATVRNVIKEKLEQALNAGEVELVSAIAQAIPGTVIGRLLGIPEADLHQVWSLSAAFLVDYDLLQKSSGSAVAKGMVDTYFLRHLALARTKPVSPLMALLVEAQQTYDVSDKILADVCSRLLAAGSSTTAGCIGNILARLLQNSTDVLPANPSPRQWGALIDELLRLETPVLGMKRQAEHDLELSDGIIRKGQKVLLIGAAANRDPAHFPAPDTINLARGAATHLSFGRGAIHCLGAPLARKEIGILLEHLLPLLPGIEVMHPPTCKGGWLLHEPAELWVKIRCSKS